jgi:hypothetical protein
MDLGPAVKGIIVAAAAGTGAAAGAAAVRADGASVLAGGGAVFAEGGGAVFAEDEDEDEDGVVVRDGGAGAARDVGAAWVRGVAVFAAAGGAAAGRVAGLLDGGRGLGAAVRAGAVGSASGLSAGPRSGRIAANWDSVRCSFGVSNFVMPCETMRVSMMIMITPTMARRLLTARTSTAERKSPKSNASTGPALGLLKASAASRTALCSSGPMELSLSQSTSPSSSCRETAWVRAGSTAARTF